MSRSVHKIKLDDNDVEWFTSTYPDSSLSWVCSTMLSEFRALHTSTPLDLIKRGAQEMKGVMGE